MAGIQTIGLGSDNKLSLETVDQLKEVDRGILIDPIDEDIETSVLKRESLAEVVSLLETLKSSTDSLAGDNLYLNRSGFISDTGININIDKGVALQDISIDVDQLAEVEVRQSAIFESRTSAISSGDGTISIEMNGVSEEFDVTADTTLEDLMQMINDSSLDATAKILNTGRDEYRLILSGETTGQINSFTITESENLNTSLTSEDNLVQNAKDATISYNGVQVTRDSNKIEDLISGVSFELTQVTDNPITIQITEDIDSILAEAQKFVDSYNELALKLDDLTKFDETTKETGVFQGNSNIRGIERELNKMITTMDSNNNSLINFGMSLNETGTLTFESETFLEKYNESPEEAQYFFKGDDIESRGVTSHPDGVFYQLEMTLDRYVGTDGSLDYLRVSLENQEDRLNKEREKALELLNKRYDRMAEQFAQQDAIIGQINQQFASIQMQIDFQTAKQ
jgi:flagellar hook-associated protein 2